MKALTRLLPPLLIFLLVPAPLFAQFASSSLPTSTPLLDPALVAQAEAQAKSQDTSGSSNAFLLGLGAAGLLGLGLLSSFGGTAASVPAARASRSFGGTVIAAIPCVSSLGPALQVTIKPAGVFSPTYIWTAATITKLQGPPRTPKQQILGIYDVPFVCFIPGKPPIPLYGLRMTLVGTSLH